MRNRVRELRVAAMVAGLVSMLGCIAIARLEGDAHGQLWARG